MPEPGSQPNTVTESFFDPVLAERLSAIPLTARQSMLGTVSGRHQSPHRGSSVEFAEYRRYQPGDDLRRLDWRAYGRSDRYYVKEFEADTNLRLVLVVDGSGSMGFGDKLHAARQIASTLAYIAIGQGDAAGMIGASDSDSQLLPPRRIAGQVSLLFDRLKRIEAAGVTTLEQTLHRLAEMIRQRALIVVISDLLFEPSALRSAVEHLAFCKHDVALFHLMDPAELQPNWDRPIRLEDMEGDESILVDPDEIAAGYDEAVREFLQEVERISRETSVDYHRVMLDRPIEESLMRFLAGRARESAG
ncbi:hypothetical protein Mal15_07350 [Stieleria maiorica]|uniref:DUF58 domain-containing protein n=1 Tax=Stieleria maiorica TaxID=2795974 RepID=A0A5B9MBX6_9BACT|nr:DUF58 domain-containing protein [Stieleria maiorica]QEF96707.1 hypothetical protein Mal15_07350 [Stieleria maiorica]